MQTLVNVPPFQLGYGAEFPKLTQAMFAAEPSLKHCSEPGVGMLGGPLTQIALKHVQASFANEIRRAKEDGLSAMVDVVVQYLSPGMFPAAPGWHCDYVPRGQYDGQPCFGAVNNKAFTVALSLSTEAAGVSKTEYVTDPVRLKLYSADQVYRDLHEQVLRVDPARVAIQDGVFVRYTPKTIHRAVEANRRGWRMLFRFSMCEKPPIINEVPKQLPIYVMAEGYLH